MFILGIIGVLQVIWLPGFILLRIANIRTNRIGNLAFGFGLSLTFNYALVLILISLKIFYQWLLFIIIGIEIVIALWITRKQWIRPIGDTLRDFWLSLIEKFTTFLVNLKSHFTKKEYGAIFRKISFIFFFLLALIPLWWVIRIFVDNLGTVFNSWDAVISWNTWATQWVSNNLPQQTWRYPQLIPTNWAFIYVLIGNVKVQFFSKALMPLFLFSILLLMVGVGLKKRQAGFFLGGVITYFVIKHFLGEFIPEGYVDIPVAFMSFASIATLFWAGMQDEDSAKKTLWLGAVLAGGAAVTKHTGLYCLAAFPLLAYLLVIRKFRNFTFGKVIRQLLVLILISVVIAAPWYMYKEYTFMIGSDEPETGIISNVLSTSFGESGLFTRLQGSMTQLGKYLALYVVILLSLFFLENTYRWLAVFIIIPFTLLWALFLGYDIRNLTIAMPFLSLVSGICFVAVFEWVYGKVLHPLFQKLPCIVIIIIAVLFPVAANFLITKEKLNVTQVTLQKQLFSKSLDENLYSYFGDEDLSHVQIATNYPVAFLPGFENTQIKFSFNELQVLRSLVDDPAVGYLLVPVYAAEDNQEFIQSTLDSGKLIFLFEDSSWIGYSFYKIIR